MEEIDLDLTLPEETVKVKDKKGTRTFIVRQFDGFGRDSYQQALKQRVLNPSAKDGEQIQISTIGLAAHRLSQCLFEVMPDGKERKVPLEEIQSWAPKAIDKLSVVAERVCDLDDKAEERAKNA